MAAFARQWTLAEVHSLPDDGNKYELVRGELLVTPPPTEQHETIAARLTRLLDRYVEAQGLGYVYRPKAVMRFEGSEVEPDLMVRQPPAVGAVDWDEAPIPSLVVEIASPSTRRRDQEKKRGLYTDAGVAEYWIVDADRRVITSAKRDREDVVAHEVLEWLPPGASSPLMLDVASLFIF